MTKRIYDEISSGILENLQTKVSELSRDTKGKGVIAPLAKGRIFELASLSHIAVDYYSSAIALDPYSGDASAALVTALMKSGDAEAALEQAVKHVSEHPDHTFDTLLPNETISAFSILGDAYALNNNSDAAEEAYATALQKDEHESYAAGRLANITLQNNSKESPVDSKLSQLAKSTQDNPRFAQVRSVARLAEISPRVASSISVTPLIEILQVAVPGRPFIVEGKRLRAESVLLDDAPGSGEWQYDLQPDLAKLTDEQKGILGDRWMDMGREEHASVASFSKFVSQLMVLGAPAELVDFGVRSMQDEAEHAKLCFGIASAAYGRKIAVGPIEMDSGYSGAVDRWAILYDTIVEGCVGETISTAIAVEAIRQCENDVIRDVLTKVAQDESNHAKLAWDFVEWMLMRHPDLIEPVEAVFTAAEREAKRPEVVAQEISEDMAALVKYGVLWEELAHEQTYGAFFTKVLPRANSLLERVKAIRNDDQVKATA